MGDPLVTQKQLLAQSLRAWLPLAVLATLMSALIIGSMQMYARQSANNPQRQLAEDGALKLSQGASPSTLLLAPTTLETSLAPFVMVYDASDRLLVSSAKLDNADPVLPPGVIDYARRHDTNTVTWQPRGGLRFAVVAKLSSGGNGQVVVVGRSLRDTEELKDKLTVQLLYGWALTLGVLFVTVTVLQKSAKNS